MSLIKLPGIYLEKVTIERFIIEFDNKHADLVNEELAKGNWRFIRSGPKMLNARQASGTISQYIVEREIDQ